jgi:hypothetical protein
VFSVFARTLHLELVVVEADNFNVREVRDCARGSAHTASNIKHTHPRLQSHMRSQVMLMAR